MDELVAFGTIAGMGGVLLVLYARLRGAILDRDMGIMPKSRH